jgi:hypothetical protein
MKIKLEKSKAVGFTRARVKDGLTYYFGDQLIPEGNNFKYLGIIIRSDKHGRPFNNAYTQTGIITRNVVSETDT